MLWALAFRDGRAHPGDEEDLTAAPSAPDAWTWAHFPLGDVRARAFIARMQTLPAGFQELIESDDQRLQFAGDGVWAYGVLPDLERDLAGEPRGAGRLFFALDDRLMITARVHALRVVDDVRREAEQGLRLERPADAAAALVDHYTELLDLRLDQLTVQLAAVEDLVLSEPSDVDGLRLGPLRRELARHRRELQALRGALARGRLARNGRSPGPLLHDLERLAAPIGDLDREAGDLQERARLLHEEIDTLITSATNRGIRTLTVISTLLIPPTLVVGAFGMNVRGIPFAGSRAGFAIAVLICVALVTAALLLLRRLKLLP
ncbi:MAG: CorA family divalent cation transporter [Phenylobacterium sp.]|nr:CorA family divalent cation transporter [Phenylobacterium sp.]